MHYQTIKHQEKQSTHLDVQQMHTYYDNSSCISAAYAASYLASKRNGSKLHFPLASASHCCRCDAHLVVLKGHLLLNVKHDHHCHTAHLAAQHQLATSPEKRLV
jgi:hypothetical protein